MRNALVKVCTVAAVTLGLFFAAKTGCADEPAPSVP